MSVKPYESPTVTELGSVHDLTQISFYIKVPQSGYDAYLNRNSIVKTKKVTVTVS